MNHPSSPATLASRPPLAPWWERSWTRTKLVLRRDSQGKKAWHQRAAHDPALARALYRAGVASSFPYHESGFDQPGRDDRSLPWLVRMLPREDWQDWLSDRVSCLDVPAVEALLAEDVAWPVDERYWGMMVANALTAQPRQDKGVHVTRLLLKAGATMTSALPYLRATKSGLHVPLDAVRTWLAAENLTLAHPVMSAVLLHPLLNDPALYPSNVEGLRRVLEFGVNPNVTTRKSLKNEDEPRDISMLSLLLRTQRSGNDPESQVCLVQMFELLVAHGAMLDTVDSQGQTLLHAMFDHPFGPATPAAIIKAVLAAAPQAPHVRDAWDHLPEDYLMLGPGCQARNNMTYTWPDQDALRQQAYGILHSHVDEMALREVLDQPVSHPSPSRARVRL